MGETPSYAPYGEADSHLEEVVPGIAFPLTALSEMLKYLPSLLGAYMKAGKVLLQEYYSLTLKHSPHPPTLGSTEGWISYESCNCHLGPL